MELGDVRVATVEQTSGGCPEQYEGTLIDGREFYFRYRHGWASLGLGEDRYSSKDAGMAVGDGWAGVFESEVERDRTFRQLLDEATGVPPLSRFNVLIDPTLLAAPGRQLTEDQLDRIAAILREGEESG